MAAPVWPSGEEQRGNRRGGQTQLLAARQLCPPRLESEELGPQSLFPPRRGCGGCSCEKSRPIPWVSEPPRAATNTAPTRPTGSPGTGPSPAGHCVQTRGIFRSLTSRGIQLLIGVLETRGSCGPDPSDSTRAWEIPSAERGLSRLAVCPAGPTRSPRGCCRAVTARERPACQQQAAGETSGGTEQCGHRRGPLDGSLLGCGG